MKLESLDIHSNSITSEGFCTLMTCLRTFNKVKSLNVSHNIIANDLRNFRIISKFLNTNRILEDINLASCEISEKACHFIARGLRGNLALQSLILRDNPIKKGMVEIAKSFCFNKKALCLKYLDVAKCQLTCEHITDDFTEMLASPFTTLKFLSLRDNLIRYKASEAIKDALQ